MIFRPVFCGFCSTKSNQLQGSAPDPSVVPDLDTRPGENSVASWLEQCPQCGYAAADISSVHEKAGAWLEGDGHRQALNDESVPEPARRFLVHALVLREVGQLADAGWISLQGAWVCDDLGQDAAAIRFRSQAIEYWLRGRSAGEDFASPGEDFALIADVLRRAGRLEEALRTVNEGLACEELPGAVEQILRFEKTLIQGRETGRRALSDLPSFHRL